MLRAKFYLKESDKEITSLILKIYHRANDKDFKYPLKIPISNSVIYIPSICWDSKKQEPVKNADVPKRYKSHIATIDYIRSLIMEIKGYINEITLNAQVNKISISNDFLRNELNNKLGIITKKNNNNDEESILSVVQYYDKKIIGMKEGTFLQPKNGKKYKDETINSHITCKKCLEGFDIYREKVTYFQDINNVWYDEYILFLNNEQEIYNNKGELEFIKEAYMPNTIGSKHIKNLKYIMERAFNDGLLLTEEHNKDYFIRPKENSFAIALNENELRDIYNEKALNKNEQITKDLFLVGAYTCLRYSDFSALKPNNFKTIDNIEVIEKSTYKGKEPVIIPILWDELKEIVKRYNYNLPYINNQTLNDLIKVIAKRANINHIEEFYQTKGGITKLIQEPRYNLIASHTARRSAATNFIRRGHTYDTVRLLTGHKSNDQLRTYIKFDKEDNAISIAKEFKQTKDEK
jgi:integrase